MVQVHPGPPFFPLHQEKKIQLTNEGLRIERTESATGTFFDSGSAKISGDGAEMLVTLAHELSKLPNKLAFEGHTDSKQYSSSGNYGNWELSADRANAARRLMVQNDVRPDQVTQVRGFADKHLRTADNPRDSANRRISLIVQYQEKKAPAESEAGDSSEGEEKSGEHKTAEGKSAEGKEEQAVKPPSGATSLRRILTKSSEVQDCDLVGTLVIGVPQAIAFRK